jgi:beta-lactam-binding protein with PASTA domain/predicted Ser/Thr protein kinase
MAELSTGDVVDGRYRVLSRLGTGGMADVYLAEDQQLGRKVALKLLHRRFAEDPGFVERFRREAQAAAGLAHPNVVSVYDRGAYDGTYYIAMEYLPGRSLKQLIRQEAPLDPVRAIEIAVQILKAARFAHRRGVIHRDLKPHNVIVDDSGHAKVTDFGIARAGASDMTETGSIMGTAQYLSPEQAQGLAVAAPSDLYAVGVVLYEMLTGQVPFDAESPVTIALRHVSEAPVPPSQLNPAVPPELEQAVLWALNKNPADRPADAEQFIAVLERVRESILTGGAGQRTAGMPVLTAVMPAAGVAPPAAVAAAAPAGPVRGAAAPVDGNGGPPPEKERRRWWPWLVALALAALIGGAVAAAVLLTTRTMVTVPDVVGKALPVAEGELQSANLTASVYYQQSTTPANIVLRQSPLARTRVPSGSSVAIYVSNGPGNVTIPSVAGETPAVAKARLKRAGLKVSGVQREPSTTVPAGRVTGTDPKAGYVVPAGQAVTLYVSSGPPMVKVPSVVGDSQQAATQTLTGDGFKVAPVVRQPSTTVASGDVISQSPAANASVPTGSTITLTVSSGPPKVPVPDTVGESAAAARQRLRAAGFTVRERTQPVTSKRKDGRVISQSPSGGSRPKGSPVTIVVGSYRAPTGTGTSPTTTHPGSTTTNPGSTTTTLGKP